MDPVSKLSKVIAVLRSQVSAQPAKAAGGSQVEKSRPGRAKASGKATLSELRARIGKRVQAIDPDDPRRNQKAVRIFLESVLLNELGGELINDPKFYDLVTEVQAAMEADASVKDDLELLVQQFPIFPPRPAI